MNESQFSKGTDQKIHFVVCDINNLTKNNRNNCFEKAINTTQII